MAPIKSLAETKITNSKEVILALPTMKEWRDKALVKKAAEDYEDESINSAFKCPKCGSNTSLFLVQTRSADEAQTIFYQCLSKNCGLQTRG